MSTKKSVRETEKQEAIERLREWLKPGDRLPARRQRMDIAIYTHVSHDYLDSTDARHYEFAPESARVHVARSPYDGGAIGIDYSADDSEIAGWLVGLPGGTRVAETTSGDLALFLPGESVGWSAAEAITGALAYAHGVHYKGAR